ncbi:MAG: hypothetical protein WB475_10270, partial [Pseudolabrys sp.]
ARRALEKQRADELEYAQLLEDNVPAAPIYSELDGGMNKVFLARFPDRVTLSKRPGLDLAQHPIRWCTPISSSTALDRTDGGLPNASHLPKLQAIEALDIAVPAARRADE